VKAWLTGRGFATVILAVVLGVVSSCAGRIPPPPPPPPPSLPAFRPPAVRARCEPCTVVTGRTVTMTADALDPNGGALTYRWTASTGTFRNGSARQTVWTAPQQSGPVPITVTVADGRGGSASDGVTLQVISDAVMAELEFANNPNNPFWPPPDVPSFPWPPPPWTARDEIPIALLRKSATDTNGMILERIAAALKNGGFQEWSVYELGEDGFAVVAQIETIDEAGRPLPGNDRWLEDPPSLSLSFVEILRRLASAERDRYRVIVLLMTTRPLVAASGQDTDEMRKLPSEGPRTLAPAVEHAVPPASTPCYALVYEFRKLAGQDPFPLDSASSGIQALDHLVMAGLWTREELR
jgi:hypothetical protein